MIEKSKTVYENLEKNLPKGFEMDFSLNEYLQKGCISYPSATKMFNKIGGYFYNFLRIYVIEGEFELFDSNKKLVNQTKSFDKILERIKEREIRYLLRD